ncbi:MAG: NifU family protein [Rhodospirillaceae bacterium]
MFIQTEDTPNPATLKFLPGCPVTGGAPLDFPNPEGAGRSPLAERLFAEDGVAAVFLGSDFITVTRRPEKSWAVLKPSVVGAIMEHFLTGRAVLADSDVPASGHTGDAGGDDDVVRQIKELLDQRVRPAVAQDGGDITFHRFEGGVVYLHMRGSCSGCPSSVMTLKSGIENLLKHFIPEVQEVRAVR